jgi:hypothetical protein
MMTAITLADDDFEFAVHLIALAAFLVQLQSPGLPPVWYSQSSWRGRRQCGPNRSLSHSVLCGVLMDTKTTFKSPA